MSIIPGVYMKLLKLHSYPAYHLKFIQLIFKRIIPFNPDIPRKQFLLTQLYSLDVDADSIENPDYLIIIKGKDLNLYISFLNFVHLSEGKFIDRFIDDSIPFDSKSPPECIVDIKNMIRDSLQDFTN